MIYKPYIKRLKAFGFLGHLSHSGDLLLWVGVRCRASSFNILFSRTTEPILTKFGLQHLQGTETRKCKFHDPPTQRGGNYGVKSVKFKYFLKNLLLFSGAWFRQTKCVVLITKEGSTKIVNFKTPVAGVLVLGRGHIGYLLKLLIF